MSAETQGLILGIAGLVSTLISTALGLYFTARARTGPMRELLYSKQLNLAERLFKAFGRVRVYAVLLTPGSEYKDEAREDMRVLTKRLSILTDQAAILFPTELFAAVKATTDLLAPFLTDHDNGRDTSKFIDDFTAHDVKAALMARTILGIDALSDESIRLFARKDSLSGLAEWSPKELLDEARRD